MDELSVLAEMREEVPQTRYPAAYRALTAEISGRTAKRRTCRRVALAGGVLAGLVAAGTTAVVMQRGEAPPSQPLPLPRVQLVAVTNPRALAANAATVARGAPVPAATQWIYLRRSSTTSHDAPSGAMAQVPGTHQITESWTRADMLYTASVRHGRTVVSKLRLVGTPGGWPQVSYAYLNSLPTDPDALLAVVRHNVATYGFGNPKPTDDDLFDAVMALMENYTVLPARLNAALYGVLARLNVVHLGKATDNAGRSVLSLYRIEDGQKDAIFVDPSSYAYAGQRRLMVSGRVLHADDRDVTLHKGELLDDEAVLVSKVVTGPGMRS